MPYEKTSKTSNVQSRSNNPKTRRNDNDIPVHYNDNTPSPSYPTIPDIEPVDVNKFNQQPPQKPKNSRNWSFSSSKKVEKIAEPAPAVNASHGTFINKRFLDDDDDDDMPPARSAYSIHMPKRSNF